MGKEVYKFFKSRNIKEILKNIKRERTNIKLYLKFLIDKENQKGYIKDLIQEINRIIIFF